MSFWLLKSLPPHRATRFMGKKVLKVTCPAGKSTSPGLTDGTSFTLLVNISASSTAIFFFRLTGVHAPIQWYSITYFFNIILFIQLFICLPFMFRMEQIKSFEAPTAIFSASLHPSKSCFVAGGDDFKLYKFDYEDGKELGKAIKRQNNYIQFFVLK